MSAERIDTAAVLAGVDLPELVSRYVAIKPASGGEYLCLCPFHHDSSPSCRIIPAKGFIYCHACNWHGNAIDFVMEYTGAPFVEAVRSLNGTLAPSAAPIQRPSLSADTSVDWQPVVPVPATAPPMDSFQLWNPKRDRATSLTPTATYTYRDPAGAIVGHVLRVETDNGKITPTVTYCTNIDTGEQRWCLAPFPRPRPLYGLDRLTANPAAKVLLVEGERCVDAAAPLWGAMVVTTWPGGTAGAKHTDWTPLAGRDVVMWPDNDDAGQQVMHETAAILALAGCTLRIVPPPGIDQPKGWDVADAVSGGQTADQVKAWVKARLVPYTPPLIIAAQPARDEKKPPDEVPAVDGAEPIIEGVEQAAEESPVAQGDEGEGESSTPPADHTAVQESTTPDSPPAKPKRSLRGPGGVDLGVVDGNTIRKPKSKQPELSPLTLSYQSWDDLGLDRAPGKPPHCNVDNVTRVLTNHNELKGHFWFDEFMDRVYTDFYGTTQEWTERHDTRLTIWFQRKLSLSKMAETTVSKAVIAYAYDNVKNQCREWMDSLAWDGTPRLHEVCSKGFGSEDTGYTQAVGRVFILGMVMRVKLPGCKNDTMPVFEGGQGSGKSTALKILGGDWFTECHENVTSKDFFQVMRGKMLIEIAEMHAFSKYDVKRVKGVISNAVDNYRPSYGRYAIDHPRMSAFGGTTNQDDWNEDDTGARRFYPIKCGDINLKWIRNNREQLFAEAVTLFDPDPESRWWYVSPDEAKKEQDKRIPEDAINQPIEDWLRYQVSKRFTVHEVIDGALGVKSADMTTMLQYRARRALSAAGWKTTVEYDEKTKRAKRFWVPIDDTVGAF